MREETLVIGGKEERKLWPFLLLLLVAFLYFRPLLLLEKIPWISDIKSYYLPNWNYLSHLLRQGGFSFWCPGIYCGFPLFADSEMGIFYPLNPLFMLLPSPAGFNYSLILHYLLGGCFLYLYCRRLDLGRTASLFAAAPFMVSGFYLAHLVHPNVITTLAWLPLFLYLLERALAEERFSYHLLAGVVLGLQFLSGFLMIPLMELVFSLFYVLFHPPDASSRRPRTVALGAWAAAMVLALGLGMVQNLPSYYLVNNSYRAGGLSATLSNMGNLPVLQLAGMVFPRAFGKGIGQSGYLGAWTFEETYLYVGILPLLFAPAALKKPRRWPAAFFFWAGVTSLLLSLGNQGMLWPVLRRLPGFHVLKGPSRFFLVSNLSFLILGAMGFDRWRRGDLGPGTRRRMSRRWIIAAAVSTMSLYLLILLYRLDFLHFREFAAAVSRPLLSGIKSSSLRVLDQLATYFTSPHIELLIPFVMLGMFVLLMRIPKGRARPHRGAAAVVLFLVVLDVFFMASTVLKPVGRNRVEYRPAVLDVLAERSAEGRVALLAEPGVNRGEFSLAPNQLLPYGIDDAFGFSTIPPARIDRLLGLLKQQPHNGALALLGVETLFSNLVRVQGIPYDFGAPYTLPKGMGAAEYRVEPAVSGKELRLLLDGSVLELETYGTIYLKMHALRGGRVQQLPLLIIEKDTGEDEYLLSVMYNQGPVNFQRVRFRSPGFGDGREALEIRVPARLRRTDRLVIYSLFTGGLQGTRLAALSLVDEDGRGVPLLPWPLVYSDGRYAVYRLEEAPPFAFSAWEVEWTDDWRSAVDLAYKRGYQEGKVILAESEIESDLRERLENLSKPGRETRVEILRREGDHVLIRASAADDAVLIISQDYLPGWRALLDGKECRLFSAYGFLTALYLPAGEHLVSLDYHPPGLTAGGIISALSLLAFLGIFIPVRRRERARVKARAEASLPPPDRGGISAFFPCYNDSATIGEVVEKALAVLRELTPDHEVIIVDDGSSDASGAVIDAIAAAHPEVRVVRHDRNRGYGAALRSGIKTSTKEWVFYTDSDGQYDVEDLRRLYPFTGTADVINGYKEGRSDPWYRVVLGSIYNFVVRRLFQVPIRDVDCDFRLMRGELARSLDLRSEGGSICVELVKGLQARGAVFAEVPVRHFPRREGRSQFFRLKNVLAMVKDDVTLWLRLFRKGEI